MAEWSHGVSKSSPGDHGAESHPEPKEGTQGKRPREEAGPSAQAPPPSKPTRVLPSKGQSSKNPVVQQKKRAKTTPTTPALNVAPLDIIPLRCSMASML